MSNSLKATPANLKWPGANEKKEVITMTDYSSSAAALYDGGWRADDRDELITEYQLTEEEADELCKILAEFDA